MPRPKGSKNKKTLEREAAIDGQIAELKKKLPPIEREIKKLEAEIAAKKEKYNVKRQELRMNSRELARLVKRKKALDEEAAAKAAAQAEAL